MADLPIKLEDLDQAPSTLATREPISFDNQTKLMEQFTRMSEENFQFRDEIHRLKADLRTKQALDDLIKPSANRSFVFMCFYCAAVAALLVLSGFKTSGFSLDSSVLTYLVGSTAVTVIGLVGMVLTGIFVGARKPSG